MLDFIGPSVGVCVGKELFGVGVITYEQALRSFVIFSSPSHIFGRFEPKESAWTQRARSFISF